MSRTESVARPRILGLTQSLPYPPHSGVANRTLHILEQLAVEFDVHLVPFSRRQHQPSGLARSEARAALEARVAAVSEPVPIPGEQGAFRKTWDHLRSLLSGRPYTWYEYESDQFKRSLEAALTLRPSLIHLDSLDLHRWLELLPDGVPVACTHHSIESDLLRLRASYLSSSPARGYLRLQADRLESLERSLTPTFACNVMMSDLDAQRLRTLAPAARTTVIPNGVDLEYFDPSGSWPEPSRAEPVIAFVGPAYSYPNEDAIRFFVTEVWPLVRRAVPDARFEVLGRCPPEIAAGLPQAPGVSLVGEVPDLRPYLSRAFCVVVPIRIGGGTRLKVLDAWAMAKAVVSTSVGCEGLATREGENLLVRDEPQAFAEAIVTLHASPAERQRLGDSGRLTAARLYGWPTIGASLRRLYSTLI